MLKWIFTGKISSPSIPDGLRGGAGQVLWGLKVIQFEADHEGKDCRTMNKKLSTKTNISVG